MSATHKPTLHLSALGGRVLMGRVCKDNPELIAEPVDVTARFHAIMLDKYGPGPMETKETTVLRATDPQAPVYRITIERIEG